MRAAVLCLLLFGFRSDPSPLAGIPAHGLTYANDDVEFEVPAAVSVAATQSNEEQAQVEISSVPSGAEIELDGKSVGTTPASIQVSPESTSSRSKSRDTRCGRRRQRSRAGKYRFRRVWKLKLSRILQRPRRGPRRHNHQRQRSPARSNPKAERDRLHRPARHPRFT